jgi:Tfp pilus assembly protein PilP
VVSTGATPTSVAQQATQTGAINLSELTLVGLFGAAGARRALLRLPSGRFQTVEVGDRVDGGQVVAISETQMSYVKGSNTITLKLLQSN